MKTQDKIDALQNGLITYKFPKKYFVHGGEGGKRFAIANKSQYGGITIHSAFMTFDEFNSYLFGYNAAKSKKY